MAMVTTLRGGTEAAAGAEGGGEWKEKEKEKELCLQLQKAEAWSELRNGHSPERKKKVAVVYYLSRNGHLEHPHFMEVPLSSSSSDGLYLKDVISRLSALRGRGLAGLYSWAAKRSYRNGYVWHDLTEEDFIHPVHGNEYVLKGTELLNLGPVSCSETSVGSGTSSSTSSTGKIVETSKSSRDDTDFSASSMKSQKKSWGPLELKEYNVYRAEMMKSGDKNDTNVSNGHSADASTQTDDQKRYRRRETVYPPSNITIENKTAELNTRDDISPPPTSSPETLEALVRYNRRILEDRYMMVPDNMRGKTSAVLMHLISCGSIAVKGQSVAVPPSQGARLTTREAHNQIIGGSCRFSERGKVVVEKECFSGSLLESSKEDDAAEIAAVLKKCSSFTAAERGMKKKLESPKEVEGVLHFRCMPRNSKPRKLEGCNNNSSSYLPPVSRSTRGSKRFNT